VFKKCNFKANGETAQIRPGPGVITWAKAFQITGKKIIADCGYGVAGIAMTNCGLWNETNRQARVKDGVIALSSGIGAKDVPPPSLYRQIL